MSESDWAIDAAVSIMANAIRTHKALTSAIAEALRAAYQRGYDEAKENYDVEP